MKSSDQFLGICRIGFLSLSLLVISACSINPVTGKKEVMFMSEQQEIALGKQSDPSIVAMYGLYQNEQLQKFINDKGQEMAKISHRPHLNYEFKILDSPVINAFAVPGGYVYFTRGILAHFNNEAEFAGVLGHEIGHVTARHSAKQQTKATIAQILFIGGLIVSPEFAQFANEAQQAMQLLFLKYSRDNESQSDELGVAYSTQIGYDAHHMANFFNTLNRMRSETEAESLPTFLSTHPDPLDRYNKVDQMATEAQAPLNPKEWQVNRNKYLQMIDGLVYGEDPKQGYVENNNFYHPELKFFFPIPTGWKTINTPSQVQMAPEDGKAMMMLTLTEANTPEEAAQKIIEQHKLKVIESKNVTVNGLKAYAIVSDQTNEQNNESIRILTYLISYNELIYTFHGLTLPDSFDYYVKLFNNTMRGFNILRDPSKINVVPERIVVKSVNQSTTLESFLSRQKMPADRHDEIAILNSMQLTDRIEVGTLIKTITK